MSRRSAAKESHCPATILFRYSDVKHQVFEDEDDDEHEDESLFSLLLLQWQLDTLLGSGRKLIAHDETGAGVPVEYRIVVFGWTKRFGLFVPAHRFTQQFIGVMAGTGMALM